jgi:hypothetical protein
VFVGTHACAPALAALAIDAYRLHKNRQRLFPHCRVLAIAITGALPDLLNPHFSLESRLSSWTHTVWFLLAIYPIYGIICRAWFRPRWMFLTHWLWFSTASHLVIDTLSNGTTALSGNKHNAYYSYAGGCAR